MGLLQKLGHSVTDTYHSVVTRAEPLAFALTEASHVKPTVRASGSSRPLVMVGGWGSTGKEFTLFMDKLRSAGIATVVNMQLPNNGFGDIRKSAQHLKEFVAELKRTTGAETVDVVTHSEGGLVLQHYLKSLDGAQHVAHAIGLGTPYGGIRTALSGVGDAIQGALLDRAASQMLHKSTFMKELHTGNMTPGPTKYMAMISPWDGMVRKKRGLLPEAPNVTNVVLSGGPLVGNHRSIIGNNREVLDGIINFVSDRT